MTRTWSRSAISASASSSAIPNQIASGRRLDGYNAALPRPAWHRSRRIDRAGPFHLSLGLDAAERLLAADQPPTAIFATNDDMAAATVAVAHRRPRRAQRPHRLRLRRHRDGDHDLARADHHPPADPRNVARAVPTAGRRDPARRAGEPAEHQHMLLDFTLVRRESDAAPRAARASWRAGRTRRGATSRCVETSRRRLRARSARATGSPTRSAST